MWGFPRKVPHAGEAIDYRDLNDALAHFSEMDGRLGEDNWSDTMQAALTRKDDLAEDISMRVAHVFTEYIDVSEKASQLPEVPGSNSPVALHPTGTWETVAAVNVMTRGGEIFMLGSVQFARASPSETATSALDITYRDYLHLQLGFRIDGAVYPVLVIGDQDDLEEGENMELGLQGWCVGAVTEGVVPVPAGQHRIELVARAIPSRDFDGSLKDLVAEVDSRDFFVAEMW